MVHPHRPLAARRALRLASLDLLVDFGAWPRFDAWLSASSGARFSVGFETSHQYRHFAYDRVVAHDSAIHERENYRRLLGAIGVDGRTPPAIDVAGDPRPHDLGPAPFAVFHPWSSGYRGHIKEWDSGHWVALGRALAARGWRVLVTGSAAEASRASALVGALVAAGAPAENVAGRYSLRELAGVLVRSEIVVSVNTGVMHLAALTGARTVSRSSSSDCGSIQKSPS